MSQSLHFLLFLSFAVLPLFARAESSSSATSNGTEISEEERTKVKKRLYPGGRDEEPLQVQQQLATPSKTAVSTEDLPDADGD